MWIRKLYFEFLNATWIRLLVCQTKNLNGDNLKGELADTILTWYKRSWFKSKVHQSTKYLYYSAKNVI